MACHVSVFAENKPGRLSKITGLLAESNVNLRAITIAGTQQFGVINLLVDKPDLAYEVLIAAGLPAKKHEIVAIEIDDVPGSLHSVLSTLSVRGVNVNNAYGFLIHDTGKAVFVFDVENPRRTAEILSEEGIKPLTDSEIAGL